MKTRKAKPTDDQIEAEVLAKRGDSSAWEGLPLVSPSTSPRSAWMLRSKHLDLAAKFHVLSVLHRLGVEANLALGQPDNVDITVLGKAGQAVTIDVKTIEGMREWPVEPFSARRHHYIVIVEFGSRQEPSSSAPHVYVLASEELQKFLARRRRSAVSLDVLERTMGALEAWQLITTAQAA